MVLGFRSALCRFHRLQEVFSYPSQGFLLISREKDPQKSRTQKNFIKLYHYGLISRRLSTNLTSKCCALEEKKKQLVRLLYCQCLEKQVTFGKIENLSRLMWCGYVMLLSTYFGYEDRWLNYFSKTKCHLFSRPSEKIML